MTQLHRNGHAARTPPRRAPEASLTSASLVTHDQLEELAELVADRVAKRRTPRFIDARAAATLLGVPATWILAEARADRIPHIRLGRYVRFEPDQLIAWSVGKQHG